MKLQQHELDGVRVGFVLRVFACCHVALTVRVCVRTGAAPFGSRQKRLDLLESSFNFKVSRAVTRQVGNLEQRNKKLEKWNDALETRNDELSSDIAALGEHRVQQERALKNAQKKERTTQKRLNLAHAKARGLKETVESERETKDELLDELKTLRAKLEKLEKCKDMLSISELLGPAENKSSTIPLQLVELGMSLLSKNISATACVGIFESFVALEHHVAGAPPKMRHRRCATLIRSASVSGAFKCTTLATTSRSSSSRKRHVTT